MSDELKEAFAKYGEKGQSYMGWLEAELDLQLDIIADSSRRVHHLVGPLSLASRLANELERVQHD